MRSPRLAARTWTYMRIPITPALISFHLLVQHRHPLNSMISGESLRRVVEVTIRADGSVWSRTMRSTR
jgi:hypothetical protein